MTVYTNIKPVFASYVSGVYSSVHESQEAADEAAFNLEPVNGMQGRVDAWEPGSLKTYDSEGIVYGTTGSKTAPLFNLEQVRWAF